MNGPASVLGILLVGCCGLWACTPDPARDDPGPDLSTLGLTRRLNELRPTLERLVGAKIAGPLRVVAYTNEELVAERLQAFAGNEDLARIEAEHLFLFGRFEPASGEIAINSGIVERFAGHGMGADRIAEALDRVMIHEAVHVHQSERLEIEAWIAAGQGEGRLCRKAALEGHAEHVTQEVAEELGWRTSIDEAVPTETPKPMVSAEIFERDAVFALYMTALHELVYDDGEEFVRAMASVHTTAGVLQSILDQPPTRTWMIAHPDLYLRGLEVPDFLHLQAVVELILGEGYAFSALPVDSTTYRILAMAGEEAPAEHHDLALRGVLSANVVWAGGSARDRRLRIRIGVAATDSDMTGARLVELLRMSNDPDGSDYQHREGSLVVDIDIRGASVFNGSLRELARRIFDGLAAASGADSAPPWKPKFLSSSSRR